MPIIGYSQVINFSYPDSTVDLVYRYSPSSLWKIPQPEVQLLRVELKKDTLFVYRHVKIPPHQMSITNEWHEYNDREVYVVGRMKEIVLVATERVKTRKVKVEAEEEYW